MSSITMSQTETPKSEPTSAARERFRWRRLFQFNLRTLLFVVILLCSAFFAWWMYTAHDQWTEAAVPGQGEEEVQKLFARWKSSVDKELRAGGSWVMGNRQDASDLAKIVPLNLAFFRKQLKNDKFVAVILEMSELRSRTRFPRASNGTSLEVLQEEWIEFLSKDAHKDSEAPK